jgi:hypothetical protein
MTVTLAYHYTAQAKNIPNYQQYVLPMTITISGINSLFQIDDKWEYPRKHITLEKVLGEGEFGKVLQAKAKVPPINGCDRETVVAIKMLKSKLVVLNVSIAVQLLWCCMTYVGEGC